MERQRIIEFLENRLAEYKATEPQAFNLHAAYDRVITDLMGED